jgi:hypothetical protein
MPKQFSHSERRNENNERTEQEDRRDTKDERRTETGEEIEDEQAKRYRQELLDYESRLRVNCLCCSSPHTMTMDDIENTLSKEKNMGQENEGDADDCAYFVHCGYGSAFDMMTLYFHEKESWMANYRTETRFVCDRCIARYILRGKLSTHRYEGLKKLANFPDGVDLGKAQMEAYRLGTEW